MSYPDRYGKGKMANVTFMMATLTLVACVLVLVIEMPLKSSVRVFVLMAVPNRERIAPELNNGK